MNIKKLKIGQTIITSSKRVKGVVKWFNDAKGYGMIIADKDDGRDIFVHHLDIEMDGFKTLAEGQKIEFDLIEGPKGLQAKKVKPLE